MKITKLTVEKFRAIKFAEIELSQETAFVGQNSSGKSSLLRALNAFFNFSIEKEAFKEGRHSFRKTTTAIITIELSDLPDDFPLARVSDSSKVFKARLKYRKSPVWQIFENGNWVSAPSDMHVTLSKYIRYVHIPMKRDHEVSGWGDESLLRSVVAAWFDRYTERRDAISPKVCELGTRIKNKAFGGLNRQIKSVVPINANYSFELEYRNSPNYTLFLQDLILRVKEGDTVVDIQDCGSGTQNLTAFALYSYLAELEGNTYVLGIEEPEQNLHPHAQRELLSNLKKLPLQVLFTTHSTIMLDELDHENVVLCRRVSGSRRGVEVETSQIKGSFWSENSLDRSKYYMFHRQRNSDFFFSKHVVLVESPIDGEVVKYILREEGIDQSTHSLSIYSVDGVESLPYAYKLLSELNMSFSVVVDKDYFMPYLNDKRKDSLDGKGFPKYRKEYKSNTILNDVIQSEEDRQELLSRFHSNHSRAMEFLDGFGIYCFRWALEVDLIASQTAKNISFDNLDICEDKRNSYELLVNYSKKIKKLEFVISVLQDLPKRNYPHSYARIRKSLPKRVRFSAGE